MRSVTTVLIELCLLHCVIGWRNSTSHFKQVKPDTVDLTLTFSRLSITDDM